MTYALVMDDFKASMTREFSFLPDGGFAGPVYAADDNRLEARFAASDLEIRIVCLLDDLDPITTVTRPSLGRRLDLETLHALNAWEESRDYPTSVGRPAESRVEFGQRLALEAALLRKNLAAARERDELYEEAGGRV